MAESRVPPPGPPPDLRFGLANERTYLAYVRTSIGLVAAGVAVFHVLEPAWPQMLLGVLLVLAGAIAAVGGWVRYRQADRAIRDGRDLPAGLVAPVLTVAVLVCIAVAALGEVVRR